MLLAFALAEIPASVLQSVMLASATQNLNNASKAELVAVDQISNVIAERLIDGKPFRAWREVSALNGVGRVRIKNLQAKFCIPKDFSDEVRPATEVLRLAFILWTHATLTSRRRNARGDSRRYAVVPSTCSTSEAPDAQVVILVRKL